jgi:hypothetical protein
MRIPEADSVSLRIQNMGAFAIIGCVKYIGPYPVDHLFESIGVWFDFTPHFGPHIVGAINSDNNVWLIGSAVIEILVPRIHRVVVKSLGYLRIALEPSVSSGTANGHQSQDQANCNP